MKVELLMGKKMVMEFIIMEMETCTKVIGKKTKKKEKENFSILMETVMLDNLHKDENKVTGFINGRMEIPMKETFVEI